MPRGGEEEMAGLGLTGQTSFATLDRSALYRQDACKLDCPDQFPCPGVRVCTHGRTPLCNGSLSEPFDPRAATRIFGKQSCQS